jgi:hypothetical protein
MPNKYAIKPRSQNFGFSYVLKVEKMGCLINFNDTLFIKKAEVDPSFVIIDS